MNNEIKLWGMGLSLIALLIICLTIKDLMTDKRIAEAIENGADPIRAKCAFVFLSGQVAILCANIAEKP